MVFHRERESIASPYQTALQDAPLGREEERMVSGACPRRGRGNTVLPEKPNVRKQFWIKNVKRDGKGRGQNGGRE